MGDTEKTDSEIFGVDLYDLIQVIEKNASYIADGHFTIMRFTNGWKACYGTPAMIDKGRPEGGLTTVKNLPEEPHIESALYGLLTQPTKMLYDRVNFLSDTEQCTGKDQGHADCGCDYCNGGEAQGKLRLVGKGSRVRVVLERKKKSKKKKHGRGSIYKVKGCVNWFIKFVIHGKKCYMRTSSPDKKAARKMLKKEVALELVRWALAEKEERDHRQSGIGA